MASTGASRGKVGTGIGSSWKGIPDIEGPDKKRTGKIYHIYPAFVVHDLNRQSCSAYLGAVVTG
ncbi:MAG: hypothetical protein Q8918_10845 [Bacteroidota bacterium]|nr:hypothetical protein [Bacteroidota bacterium]MDP4212707.1 hypothetical protein [Bacteroidota bacterium]MDP4250593.1 hypothetical protein [Bacteroidota bacterium]